VTGCSVERPAAGDQPQGGVVGVAVDELRREVILGENAYPVHPEDRDQAVGAGDQDLLSRSQISEMEEHRWSPGRGVDVTDDDRRPEGARGR